MVHQLHGHDQGEMIMKMSTPSIFRYLYTQGSSDRGSGSGVTACLREDEHDMRMRMVASPTRRKKGNMGMQKKMTNGDETWERKKEDEGA